MTKMQDVIDDAVVKMSIARRPLHEQAILDALGIGNHLREERDGLRKLWRLEADRAGAMAGRIGQIARVLASDRSDRERLDAIGRLVQGAPFFRE
jgi:hypothetical protein